MKISYRHIIPIFLIITGGLTSCNQKTNQTPVEIPETENKKPNIILIMTDDQGYGDIALNGNKHIKTPNLNKLGQESIQFSNFHVATSCAPTRAGLMSGMNCNRAGAWHTVNGRSFLSKRFTTVATVLKNAGYQTGIFGKWHLGDNYPYRPQDRGFDEVLIHGGGGIGQIPDAWNNDYFDDTYFYNGEPKKFSGYCTDIWFDESMRFIKEASEKEKPFFCYITPNAPHSPFHVPQKYIDMYKDNSAVPNPNFYGMITNMDENIGKLQEMLEQQNLLENTILIFLTDNGTSAGVELDEEQYVTKGFNAGMRGKKISHYDGGHRVPLFVKLPKQKNETGTIYDQLVTYTDLTPTILDLVNISKPKNVNYDGVSLKPLLTEGKQENLNNRFVIVDTQRNEFPEKWKKSCVMQGNWRLIDNKELYNVTSDLSQRTNVMEQNPEIAKKLADAYENWWSAIEEDLKIDNLISLGNKAQNPTLLTSHDWHSDQPKPWNQQHIREAKIDNGYWLVDVEQAGLYDLKLYRWPPELNKKFTDSIKKGDDVPGGTPYSPGKIVNFNSAKLKVDDKEFNATKSIDSTYFQFKVNLNKGKATLQTWLNDDTKANRGAYYVQVEKI